MTIDESGLDALLRDDAAKRAELAAHAAPSSQDAALEPGRQALRVRLMGSWPREARPAFDAVGRTLAAYGYALSPLHPASARVAGSSHSRRAMQTQLTWASHEGGAFAPLVFALDEASGDVQVFVQQSSGRAAADFAESRVPAHDPVDQAWLEGVLREYVACMIRPRIAIAA